MSEKTQTRGTHILEREPDLLKPHLNETQHLVDNVTRKTHANLLRRLFPGHEERALRDHELAQVGTEFEFRQRALTMAVETKLQALEEMCNHVLVTGKSEIRRKRQAFFAEQRLQLQQSMNQVAASFNTEMQQRFDALEDIRQPFLREREEQRLMKSADQFGDMLDQLVREFADIINEGVSRLGRV